MKTRNIIIIIVALVLINVYIVSVAMDSMPAETGRLQKTEAVIVEYDKDEALDIAEKYIDMSPCSRLRLYKELIDREKMSPETAKETIAALDVNWDKNAKLEVRQLEKIKGYTKADIKRALRNDGYSEKTIIKVIND